MRKRPPMQPVVWANGVVRFQANALVQYLLDRGGLTLNDLAVLPGIPKSDWEQLAQLIGYSVDGFGTLSYASDRIYIKASKRAEKLVQERAKNGGLDLSAVSPPPPTPKAKR